MRSESTLSLKSRTAGLIAEVFGPAPMLTIVLVEVGFASGGIRGLWLAALAAFFVAIGPYAALVWMARRGRVTDRFVGQRSQRAPILLAVLGSLAVGLVLLILLDAPEDLVAVTIAAAIGLLVVTAVNLSWKLSIHAAIIAFVWLAQWHYLPIYVVLALVVVPTAVGWARVVERAHTPAQVLAGYLAGGAVFCSYLGLLTALS